MPRTFIDLPATLPFETQYQVLFSDLNVANHVGADRIVGIAYEAQLQLFNAIGYVTGTHSDISFITCDYEVRYLSESHYGDTLHIALAVTEFTDKSFDVRYCISQAKNGKTVAQLKTNIACFDYASKSLANIPAELRDKLDAHYSALESQ